MVLKIGINGFGRVGRCLFRVNHESVKNKFKVVAIKDIIPIENIAYLLKYDSHYGEFKGDIKVEDDYITIDGEKIPYFNEHDVKKVPWNELGVNIVVESSGKASEDYAKSIIKGDLTNVLYTRNYDHVDLTIVEGVNNSEYNPGVHKVISASSCTGNAIVPITNIINSKFGIEKGRLVTIHPVLSDQKLIDVSHKKFNLGRNALMSIIPTSTGIAESIYTIIPELRNKLTAISYRVPTSVVSTIDVSFHLKCETSVEEINSILGEYSKKTLKGIIKFDKGYLGHSKVSIDFLKSPYSAIVLGLETQYVGKNISLSLFHDNEWGYCCRVHDLLNFINKKNLEK